MAKLTTISSSSSDITPKTGLGRAGMGLGGGIDPSQASSAVAVKINDYIPGGEKSNIWSGIDLGQAGGLGFLQDFLSNQKALGGGIAGILGIGKGTNAAGLLNQALPGINAGISNGVADPTAVVNESLMKTHGALMNSPQMTEVLTKNNNTLINNQFPFVQGLNSDALDKAKNYVVDGQLLSPGEGRFIEQKGIVSGNLFNTLAPQASMSVSWGQAFKQALTNPEVIGQTMSAISSIPGTEKMLDLMSQGTALLPSAEQIADPNFDAYTYALQQGYGLLNDQDKELLALYKYYKINSIARANNGGEGFALGEELSDSFFGSVNYNVTNFLDGTGDYIAETWQNFSFDVADTVREQFDSFNNFSAAFENATGIKLSINPAFEKGVWDTMEKLGFGNPGLGTDTMGFINNALIVRTYATIGGVQIAPENVMFYYEKYKYREDLTTTRKIKLKFLNDQLANLNLDDPNLTMSVKRMYGFALGQNPKGDLPVMYNTEMQEYDSISDWPAKRITTERGDKKAQKGAGKDKKTTAHMDDNSKDGVQWQEIEFILTPPNLLESKKEDMFNGIPKEGMTISQILQGAFETSFAEPSKLALAKPKNDMELKDAAIAPTNFTGLLQKFQSDYDIYEGGPVIYHDRLDIGGHEEDVYFVMPKRGMAEMEYEEGWEIEFRVRYQETEPNPEMVVFIIPSRKKVIWPLTPNAVKLPGDNAEFKEPVVNRYSKGSIVGVHQGIVSNSGLHHVVKETNTDYVIPKADERPKYETIYVKVDHGFMLFSPGDMVTVKLNGVKYRGNVKEWASQQSGNKRIILLTLICEIDKEKKSFLDKLSPDNWIQSMQEKIAETNAKITNTLNTWSDNVGGWLQDKFDDFHRWESANGDRIYEWLNRIDPNIEIPTFNQDANYANTQAEYEAALYGVQKDNPYAPYTGQITN